MRITRIQAPQAHPVPKRVQQPRGPFPDELFDEPEIVYDYQSAEDEGSSNLEPGATAQNNFKPLKYYRCRACDARVSELELDTHSCEE